jgi:hypothetical protein
MYKCYFLDGAAFNSYLVFTASISSITNLAKRLHIDSEKYTVRHINTVPYHSHVVSRSYFTCSISLCCVEKFGGLIYFDSVPKPCQ